MPRIIAKIDGQTTVDVEYPTETEAMHHAHRLQGQGHDVQYMEKEIRLIETQHGTAHYPCYPID